MAENNKGGGAKGNGLIYKIIGGVVLVVVVLLIVFSGPKEQPALVEETPREDDALSVVKPVVSGDYEYAFQGVKWIFDTESIEVAGTDQTWLKMEFADFTRNGNAIAFGRPYKLGVHAGTCRQTDFIDTTTETGIPFAYAICEGGGIMREFVVLQESENVLVKMREVKGPSNPSGQVADATWKEWYKINVTEIVR